MSVHTGCITVSSVQIFIVPDDRAAYKIKHKQLKTLKVLYYVCISEQNKGCMLNKGLNTKNKDLKSEILNSEAVLIY